jgi:hypothetical protein
VIGVLRTDGDAADAERPQPTMADLPALADQSRRAGIPVTRTGWPTCGRSPPGWAGTPTGSSRRG